MYKTTYVITRNIQKENSLSLPLSNKLGLGRCPVKKYWTRWNRCLAISHKSRLHGVNIKFSFHLGIFGMKCNKRFSVQKVYAWWDVDNL